jgi:DNA-binding transcriptional MerR regulator
VSYRVEELAAKADTSVDTIRYYQARNLLPPPARVGRVAWYGDDHIERLARIRRLQARGFGLAVIRRLLDGELDHADEALIAAMATEAPSSLSGAGTGPSGGPSDGPSTGPSGGPSGGSAAEGAGDGSWLTLAEVAARSGIPLAVLDAVVREGLLVPHRIQGSDRYSEADVVAAAAGLRLLELGLPLPELLQLARQHSDAMRATAARAVELFHRYVRQRLRAEGVDDETAAERLVSAFEQILPATLTLVTHHFRRTLLAVAQEHIERVGSDGERQLVIAAAERSP